MRYVLLKTRFFGLHFCYRQLRSIFKHFDRIGHQIYRIQ